MKYALVVAVCLLIVLSAVLLVVHPRTGSESEAPQADQLRGEGPDEPSDDGSPDPTPEPVVEGRTLDLSGQGLTKVPEYVFSRTDTEVLDLSDNNLSGALQAEIRHLTQLRSLDLSNNNFTGVPAEVGHLSELEVLDLSGNPLTGLPYELGNLKNLKALDLRGTSYASQDLEVIMRGLSAGVNVRTD